MNRRMRIVSQLAYLSIVLAASAPVLGQTLSSDAVTAGMGRSTAQMLDASAAQEDEAVPQVRFRNGLLSIHGQGSTLRSVLRAVESATGASITLPDDASERVDVDLAPGKPLDILASLLNGSRYDYYILLDSKQPSNGLAQIMLTARNTNRQPSTPTIRVAGRQPSTDDTEAAESNEQQNEQKLEQLRREQERQFEQMFQACTTQGCDRS